MHIATTDQTLLTQNMEQGLWNCQASVFLSVCPILHRSRGMPQVCCCGLLGQAISIIYCTAHLQPVEPPFYPYPQQHAGQQQMRAVSCLQRRSKLNTDLYQITLTTSFSMLLFVITYVFFQWSRSTVCKNTTCSTLCTILFSEGTLSDSTSKSKTLSCSCSMWCDEASDWSRDSVNSTSRSWSWSSSSHVFTASWNGRSISRLQTLHSQWNCILI